MYIYTHWKGKTSWNWKRGGSGASLSLSLSLSLPSLLCSPPSFEAPGIFPGSLLQPVFNRQRASEKSEAPAAARNKTLF